MSKDNLWNFSEFESWPKYMFPADTWLNNNVIVTSNNVATLGRRNNDVIIRITLLSDHDFHNITLASPATDYKDERMNE